MAGHFGNTRDFKTPARHLITAKSGYLKPFFHSWVPTMLTLMSAETHQLSRARSYVLGICLFPCQTVEQDMG